MLTLVTPSGADAAASGAGRAAAPEGGEVLVTPHKRFTGEIVALRTSGLPAAVEAVPPHLVDRLAIVPPEPFFVDWLTIKQTHEVELPVVDFGFVRAVDGDGVQQWQVSRPVHVEGSHDTSIHVRCDGHTVLLSGNVSRFGRADNLFGLDLAAAIRKASAIVGRFGLPPFTAGAQMPVLRKRNDGALSVAIEYTGARITRLDLTQNFATGDVESARQYLRWLATQQQGRRIQVGTYDSETVDWGRGSRRFYAKAYLKSAELLRHGGSPEVARYCESQGVVRFELTIKATQLQTMGCHFLGGLHMGRLIHLFEERRSVMARASLDVDDLDRLPRHFRATARDYLAGDDVQGRMSKVTFWRHRRALLPFGIDIAVKSGVVPFQPRVRVIELGPLAVPDWYELESRDAA